jgi:hypothetical protein
MPAIYSKQSFMRKSEKSQATTEPCSASDPGPAYNALLPCLRVHFALISASENHQISNPLRNSAPRLLEVDFENSKRRAPFRFPYDHTGMDPVRQAVFCGRASCV